MVNTNKFGIVVSFLGLWINSHFSSENQQIIGFVIIFLFGILHGSNDIAIFNKIDYPKSRQSFKKILIYYILVVIFGAFLFYCIPTIALLLFILFSGYHFGEQHWGFLEKNGEEKMLILFQTTYGLFLFSMLFYFHQDEVKLIVKAIINKNVDFINLGLITSILGLALLIVSLYINKLVFDFKNHVVINLFYLLVFAIVFKTADLIWAFAIYFVIWHSLPSIKEQINYLYGEVSLKNFMVYFKAAFPYWIISLIGIAILYFIFRDQEVFNALFFSFLAAITFPHTFIIIKMQNKKTE